MMYIISKVNKLIKQYKTSDPFEICGKIGIEVVFADIGKLKGMYTCIKRNRFIVINENLDNSFCKQISLYLTSKNNY